MRDPLAEPATSSYGAPVPGSLEPAAEAGAMGTGKPPSLLGMSRGAKSWSLFEGGRDPYVILITIYIFAPYFTSQVVGDPVKGQALVALTSTLNSLFIALTAPFLGASIERFGARKPLLLGIVALMAPMMAALWFARPGGAGLPVVGTLWLFALIGILFAYSEVVHNSLLMRAAGRRDAPHASGLALSLGNGFSVLTLVFCLVAFALPGQVDWSFLPAKPLFGLNPAEGETARIVGPIAAALLLVCAIPLFLFTPDAPRTGVRLTQALKEGVGGLWATLKSLRGERDMAVYLGSRMLFTDGMTALLIFGGIYASGVMHWGVLEMLAYGILLSIFGVIGGLAAGMLDNALGPKRALQIEIGGAIICLIAQLGMGRDKILFFWTYDAAAHAPLWNGPMFRTLPEVLYLLIGFGVAIFVTAHYATSRTLLTRLSSPEKLPAFFGLFALSGTVTVWLGSLLVNIFTSVFKSQQAGFAPIAGLLILGLSGMFFVKGGGRVRHES